MTDTYKDHIARRRAEREQAKNIEVGVTQGLRATAAQVFEGVELSPEALPAMRDAVMRTRELSVGQTLVVGLYIADMARRAMTALAAEAESLGA
jgi:hypothetical protein